MRYATMGLLLALSGCVDGFTGDYLYADYDIAFGGPATPFSEGCQANPAPTLELDGQLTASGAPETVVLDHCTVMARIDNNPHPMVEKSALTLTFTGSTSDDRSLVMTVSPPIEDGIGSFADDVSFAPPTTGQVSLVLDSAGAATGAGLVTWSFSVYGVGELEDDEGEYVYWRKAGYLGVYGDADVTFAAPPSWLASNATAGTAPAVRWRSAFETALAHETTIPSAPAVDESRGPNCIAENSFACGNLGCVNVTHCPERIFCRGTGTSGNACVHNGDTSFCSSAPLFCAGP